MSFRSLDFSAKCKTKSKSKTDATAVCHSVPCKVKTDSEAKVDTYFGPTIRKCAKDERVLLSSFRGRPLVGSEIELPQNCCAFVVNQNKKNELVAEQAIDRIVHWNLDKTPSESDSLPQVIQWIKVSEAIHKPIVSKQ